MPARKPDDHEQPELPFDEPLLKAEDAAKLLSVKPSWVYEATREGRLPHIHVGRHIRFIKADLIHWINQQRAA